jgi:hypothetical protein
MQYAGKKNNAFYFFIREHFFYKTHATSLSVGKKRAIHNWIALFDKKRF